MNKHAYLLMIHENTLVLKRLLQLLDDERNDIYIHADKNAVDLDLKGIKSFVKKSNVVFTRRHKVYWGTNSITKAEISLLQEAVRGEYAYYHLLSGADLPIKTQNQIHDFFDMHQGKEFIHFGTQQYQQDIKERYNQYHFFTKQLGRKRDKKFWVTMETYSLAVQRRLHIDRTRNTGISFYGGANWFSLTKQSACYLVENYRKYAALFRFTQNSDELFLQTMIMDSPYKDHIFMPGLVNNYESVMRYIDWNRGTPYVFRNDDFDMLMKSECMFARKFDEKIDNRIVEKIFHAVKA